MSESTTSLPSSPGFTERSIAAVGAAVSYLRIPIMASTGITALLTGLLFFKQRTLIYPSHVPPDSRTQLVRPSQYRLHDFDDLTLPTKDGQKLSAFYIRGPANGRHSDITILMFHGNAGNIGHRLPIARMLIKTLGCNVLMLEYRGYGLSSGEADESGLRIDAQTALDYLRSRPETARQRYIVYGQSLGGAVSIRLVSKNQDAGDVIGLILENTFLSIRKLIPTVIPVARYVSLLCHQIWPSEATLPLITHVPVLFLSGLCDEIVPPAHMRRLYEVCCAPVKVWKALPNGDHNSTVGEPGYFEAISDFMADLAADEKPGKGV